MFGTAGATTIPGSRWEVSPGYHLWGERKSGDQNRAATTGDRRSDSPKRLPTRRTATADEVLTELANDPVGSASNTEFFTDAPGRPGALGKQPEPSKCRNSDARIIRKS